MPLYEYRCKQCGSLKEIRHGFKEPHTEPCLQCGGEMARVFSPTGIVFKGSGFYVNDSRKSSAGKSDDAKSAETKPGDSKPAEAKSGDTKPYDAKSSDAKSSDAKSDGPSSETKSSEAKPSEAKSGESTKPSGETSGTTA